MLVAAGLLGPQPAQAASEIGVADKIVRHVYAKDLSRRLKPGERLIANQVVRTARDSAAGLLFDDDSRLALGPRSEIVLDGFVYEPQSGMATGTLNLVRGLLRFVARPGAVALTVKTPVATIGIRGTAFDVLAKGRTVEVAVHHGAVRVDGRAGSQMVRAGEVLRLRGNGAGRVSTTLPSTDTYL